MELSIKWNKKNYELFIKNLKKMEDTKYKEFHQKLLKDDNIKVIGIRTPILRKMAKEITDIDGFIKYNTHTYYEESILHALVITKIKDNFLSYVYDFIPYINNWAVNDIFAGSLKQFKKLQIKEVYPFLNSENPWSIRFGLTLLLSHYINDKDIDEVLEISSNIKNDNYYVNMANSWLLSVCYIKYKDKTLAILLNSDIDDFTFNKTISKICDSYRVSKGDKQYLKSIRRKK